MLEPTDSFELLLLLLLLLVSFSLSGCADFRAEGLDASGSRAESSGCF